MRKIVDLTQVTGLVVDDSAFSRSIVKSVLRSLGVQPGNIHEATNGVDALRAIDTVNPDIAIVDYMMEPMDGITLTKFIRRKRQGCLQTLPIIMLSAFSEQGLIARARNAGVNEYVAKPVSVETLYLRIEEVILRPPSSSSPKISVVPTAIVTPTTSIADPGAARTMPPPSRQTMPASGKTRRQRRLPRNWQGRRHDMKATPNKAKPTAAKKVKFLPPSYALKKKAPLTNMDLASVVAGSNAALKDLGDEYRPVLEEECGELSAAYRNVERTGGSEKAVSQLLRMAQEIRGHSGSIGFDAICKVCCSLCSFLVDRATLTEPGIEIAGLHLDALSVVPGNADDWQTPGRFDAVFGDLNKVINKFNNA